MSEWLTIETAPRDGTRVLLGGGKCHCEYLDREITEPMAASYERHWKYGGTWLVAGMEAGYSVAFVDAPTHWMPLPPPPEA